MCLYGHANKARCCCYPTISNTFPQKKAGEERKAIENEREKKVKVKVETAVLLLSPPSELWRLAFFIWK